MEVFGHSRPVPEPAGLYRQNLSGDVLGWWTHETAGPERQRHNRVGRGILPGVRKSTVAGLESQQNQFPAVGRFSFPVQSEESGPVQ